MTEYRFIMTAPMGLDTEATQELVAAIAPFDAFVAIANISSQKPPINARSLNKLLLLSIVYGDDVQILATGLDAPQALEAIKALVSNHFNSQNNLLVPVPEQAAKVSTLSVGLAKGTLLHVAHVINVSPKRVADVENEILRLHAAIEKCKAELAASQERFIKQGLREEALIFDVHIMFLGDQDLLASVDEYIRNTQINAAYAFQQRMLGLADEFRRLNDIHIRERATDVLDVARQVVIELIGGHELDISTLEAVIIAANEVTPSMLGKCRPSQLRGIITNSGSVFSHVAILARALGIPAIAGYRIPPTADTGDTILLDAELGEVIIQPTQTELDQFEEKYLCWHSQLAQNREDGKGIATTRDGHTIPIYGNVGDLPTAQSVIENGAEGLGLLRTEFLYLNRQLMPSEKEQKQELSEIFSKFAQKPIYVRTLDIGGDKYIPWLPLKAENNPFMGVRGVRLYAKERELFLSQLRAILLAGIGYDIKIMIPMISAVQELIMVREMLAKAHTELEAAGKPHRWPVPLGVMVETPAAVFMAAELAEQADFFSIGTNDLCQYIMAAERGSAETEALLNPQQPALLRAIKHIVAAAHSKGIEVCVCGEMAGVPRYAELLIGLGVDSLSMNALSIGAVKRAIRGSRLSEMQEKAEKALSLPLSN